MRGIVTEGAPASRVRQLLSKEGIARSRDLEAAGISRTQVRRLLAQGVLERLGRGLYRDPGAPVTGNADLIQAARQVPSAVVCLLSALRFHGMTTQNPFEVWLALPRGAWRPRRSHPPMRFVFVSGSSYEVGIEEHRLGGTRVRVFSAAKTVADCFKFRNKLGTDVAAEALRAFREAHPRQMEELWRCAEADRVQRVMRPYLEALG